jgi:hypothetical protein
MSTKPSNIVEVTSQGDERMWDNAINEANKEIQRLTKQVRRLQQAKSIFEKNKKDGIMWPEINGQIQE